MEYRCPSCHGTVLLPADTCRHCNSSVDPTSISEEDAIRFYFSRGYTYDEILDFLTNNHGFKISYNTLLRRLSSYGLRRRVKAETTQREFDIARDRISELILNNGQNSNNGYRHIWHTLRLEGISIPRNYVQSILKELDPEGTDRQTRKKFKRRKYQNQGPFDSWHMDGYDKIKPWGFPIHGAIDGFSRKILWLAVTRSNNSPDRILSFYMEAVRRFNGCPKRLISDLGTENGLAAAANCFFCDDSEAHRYVPSPRNQRIESWWGQFSKQTSSWWRNFFSDLETENSFDGTSELHKEALWFVFAPLLQKDLDFVKMHWNSHYIRPSRYDTISGRPDALFSLPMRYGGNSNLKHIVDQRDLDYIDNNILTSFDDHNIYTDYFKYVMQECSIADPTNWREGLTLYKQLIHFGENGI